MGSTGGPSPMFDCSSSGRSFLGTEDPFPLRLPFKREQYPHAFGAALQPAAYGLEYLQRMCPQLSGWGGLLSPSAWCSCASFTVRPLGKHAPRGGAGCGWDFLAIG